MGKAAEWLSEGERERIARELLTVVEEQCRAGVVGAHCPLHTERSPGGAFFYEVDKDIAYCFSCGGSVDLIGLYCVTHGLAEDDPDGFREFVERYCRGKDSSGTARRPAGKVEPPAWRPKDVESAPEDWSRRMEQVVDKACGRLLDSDELRGRLLGWGVKPWTIEALRLGWQDEERYFKFSSVGLPHAVNANGRERCVRLPVGLVIPTFRAGRVVRVQVRVDDPGDSKQRYYHLVGGEARYYVLGAADARIGVLVESARDAALLWQELGGLGVAVLAANSVTARPDAEAARLLDRCEAILLTLDNDPPGARESWGWWMERYPQALRWPVPKALGKDPGDVALRMHWRAWLLAGLPDHCRHLLQPEEIDLADVFWRAFKDEGEPTWVGQWVDFLRKLQAAGVVFRRDMDGRLSYLCRPGVTLSPEQMLMLDQGFKSVVGFLGARA